MYPNEGSFCNEEVVKPHRFRGVLLNPEKFVDFFFSFNFFGSLEMR